MMNLVIDVGNTRVKLAVFEGDRLLKLVLTDVESFLTEIENSAAIFKIDRCILSSVYLMPKNKLRKLQQMFPVLELSSETRVPFTNLYKTPKTLGVDRIALITAAILKHPNTHVLVIDAGTCITFDFITKEKNYLGGAISPGIKIRYKSLQHFTSKLPLVEAKFSKEIIGKTTVECINSGVLNGVIQEIDGVIHQYKNKFKDLTVVLTGGDTNFLSKQLKSSIFANQNFLLEGLNEILIFNNAE